MRYTVLLSFVVVLCTATAATAGQDDFHKAYCRTENMLGWYGDPELRGPVRLVHITQYRAVNNTDGLWQKNRQDAPLMRAELLIAPDGSLLRNMRIFDNNPQTLQITDYQENTTILSSEDNQETPLRYVQIPDAQGRALRLDLLQGEKLIRTEEEYTYDAAGRLLTTVNSLGQLTRYSYDEQGNIARKDMMPEHAPEKALLSFAYRYDQQGRLLEERMDDLEQQRVSTTKHTYTPDGKPESLRSWLSRSGKQKTLVSEQTWHYDASGRLAKRVLKRAKESTSNIYSYNNEGFVAEILRLDQQGGQSRTERIVFSNDQQGNWTQAIMQSPDRPSLIERRIEYYP